MILFNIPLQAAAAQGQAGAGASFWVMIILLFVVMWFFMIRPQRKRQKEMQAMQDTLKVGDKVMTANGSYGTVSKVGDRTVWVNYSGKLDIEYVRNAIVEVITEKAPASSDGTTAK